MAKKPTPHPYDDCLAFERLMLLIVTLLRYPGVGSLEPKELPNAEHRDALDEVQSYLQNLAAACGVVLPAGYPATPTLRKDIETLRRYGILDRRMYRWGYYLGTGAMNLEQLKVALNALSSQAQYQGDPLIRQTYQTLEKRLRGLDLERNGDFFYPVRAYLNRPIIYTDPSEMMVKGKYKHSLFHSLEKVEAAIASGQLIELYRAYDPYEQRVGFMRGYPLQLLYHDIAWYILYEYEDSLPQHLEVERVDRFKNHCQIIHPQGRGQKAQRESLKVAQKLMKDGWGIYLGKPEEQQLERQGKLQFEQVKVRFFYPVTTFILEGECRHDKQKINKGPKDSNGEYIYVDYLIQLPCRSFHEFSRWVYRHMGSALVLSPPELVDKHRQAAQALLARYS